MMLNRDEIRDRGLIAEEFDANCLHDAGYDLRIEMLISRQDEGKANYYRDAVDVLPQGIVAVTSKERIRLPLDVCAYASVKTSLCRDGILAINIGIIDPGWDGPISSLLLNFGKRMQQLRTNQVFLRLTFHPVAPPRSATLRQPIDRDAYNAEIFNKYDAWLAGSFMNFKKALDEAKKSYALELREELKTAALKQLPAIGATVAVLALILGILTYFLNFAVLRFAIPNEPVEFRARSMVEEVRKMSEDARKQNDELRKENDTQRKQIEDLRSRLDRVEQTKR
jgi:deoxycytidine triphosphate deaminase